MPEMICSHCKSTNVVHHRLESFGGSWDHEYIKCKNCGNSTIITQDNIDQIIVPMVENTNEI